MTSVRRARGYGISALLGLPAAFLAHTFVFGQAHTIAGSFHVLALAAVAASLFAAALFATCAALRRSQSVSPHLLGTALSATAWLAAVEAGEARHAIPTLLCLLAIAAAVWIVSALSRAYSHSVCAVATLFVRRTAAPRDLVIELFTAAALPRLRARARFELFSRPPPVLS